MENNNFKKIKFDDLAAGFCVVMIILLPAVFILEFLSYDKLSDDFLRWWFYCIGAIFLTFLLSFIGMIANGLINKRRRKRMAEIFKVNNKEVDTSSKPKADNIHQGEFDVLMPVALQVGINHGKISSARIQRELQVGYSLAARIMQYLEAEGIVIVQKDNKARKVNTKKAYKLQKKITSIRTWQREKT